MAASTPTVELASFDWTPIRNVRRYQSPAGPLYEDQLAGPRWRFRLGYDLMGDSIQTFMDEYGDLLGAGNTWILRLATIAGYVSPHLGATGITEDHAAGSSSIVITGAGVAVRAGGFLSVDDRLFSSRGGNQVWPILPKDIADLSTAHLSDPRVEVRLVEDPGPLAAPERGPSGWHVLTTLNVESVVP